MTIVLGTVFGKLDGFVLEEKISQGAELKRVMERGQTSFEEGT